jgi:methionine synthase II (cobalamin-independent)
MWAPRVSPGAKNPGMKLSSERILTTHAGSLPRSAEVVELLYKKENGEPYDASVFDAAIAGVAAAVAKQVAAGVDVVSDGETSKVGYSTYVKDRLSGFAGHHPRPPHLDLAPYPELCEAMARMLGKQAFKRAGYQAEALNDAVRDIPAARMRMHVCWGNYEGPHDHDIALEKILAIVLKAKPSAILFEAANPRHRHEWTVWRAAKLPEDKVLIPGCIASTSNYVEHPRLIAEQLCQYAQIVGRERVIAGTDCGFGSFAGYSRVDPAIAYKKLEALAAGAALATERLWPSNR